jgi:hypothetical protein
MAAIRTASPTSMAHSKIRRGDEWGDWDVISGSSTAASGADFSFRV